MSSVVHKLWRSQVQLGHFMAILDTSGVGCDNVIAIVRAHRLSSQSGEVGCDNVIAIIESTPVE